MKYAIRESVDVMFKAKSLFQLGSRTIRAGEPVLIFDTIKTATFEVTAETSYVTGGRGNSRILSFEGDKAVTFNFEDALISNEGLSILSGADLIPARNKNLTGSSPNARSVIAHTTEKYSVVTNNYGDDRTANVFPDDTTLNNPAPPRGGKLNVWLSERPYVGQNHDIYVMLLDDAGEISGAPLQINTKATEDENNAYLATFKTGDVFVAFNRAGLPIARAGVTDPIPSNIWVDGDASTGWASPDIAAWDDQVAHYVSIESLQVDNDRSPADGNIDNSHVNTNWTTAWGNIKNYARRITATAYKAPDSTLISSLAGGISPTEPEAYGFLIAPSGGVAAPRAFKEGTQIVYKVNVPSVLYQDILLLDYYKEYRHDATQVSILPDKFGPFMYVEGSSLVKRASDGVDLPLEFVIPKLKIQTALTFTMASTGDASTFTFTGDAYPDFSKFDLTRKVFVDIQILGADDNYDGIQAGGNADPTSYRRFRYNEDGGDYLFKDPSLEPHSNIDYSDTLDYIATHGGPATITPGAGLIDSNEPTTTTV